MIPQKAHLLKPRFTPEQVHHHEQLLREAAITNPTRSG
jgi:hypothetical protein